MYRVVFAFGGFTCYSEEMEYDDACRFVNGPAMACCTTAYMEEYSGAPGWIRARHGVSF